MMKYIKALELVNLAVENEILYQKDNKYILLYMSFEDKEDGWYWMEKEYAIQSLMRNKDGQSRIISKLSEKGIDFKAEYIEEAN